MKTQKKRQRAVKWSILIALVAGLLFLGIGCRGSSPTPETVAQTKMPTSSPTPEAVAQVETATPSPTPETVVQGEAPSITLAPSEAIAVPPGEVVAISANPTGVEPEVTWEVACFKDEDCQAQDMLQKTEGIDNFFTTPDTPGEIVTVRAIVTDKYDRVNSASLTITVEEPPPTFTPTPAPTDTPTLAPKVIDTPTPTSTPRPTKEPAVTITEPKREVECPEGAACIFMIKGTSTGIAPNSTYKIAPFVNPSPGDPEKWWPQLDRPLGSDISKDGTWQAEAQIGTDEGVDPGHRFEIVALVMDAKAEISLDFQPLPESIAQSNIVTLVTIAKPDEGECPFIPPFRTPIEGPSDDVEASITSIENCADNLPTASPIPVRGTYSGDMTNKELWVLVYPPNILYYPQSIDACRELSAQFANGQWAETIRLGREGVPEAFHIVVVVTEIGSPASQAFHNYLRVGCDTANYNGFTLLPPGVTELDSIVVHTR